MYAFFLIVVPQFVGLWMIAVWQVQRQNHNKWYKKSVDMHHRYLPNEPLFERFVKEDRDARRELNCLIFIGLSLVIGGTLGSIIFAPFEIMIVGLGIGYFLGLMGYFFVINLDQGN